MEKPKALKTPREYADAIRKQSNSVVPGIIEMGSLCAEAQKHLKKKEEREQLMKELKGSMSKGDFSKYVKIGTEKERLLAKKDHLPPSYTTLYELALLDPEKFDQAIADSKIKPAMNRNDALKLAGKPPKPSPEVLVKLIALEACTNQTRTAVTEAVKALAAQYPDEVEVNEPHAAPPIEQKRAA